MPQQIHIIYECEKKNFNSPGFKLSVIPFEVPLDPVSKKQIDQMYHISSIVFQLSQVDDDFIRVKSIFIN